MWCSPETTSPLEMPPLTGLGLLFWSIVYKDVAPSGAGREQPAEAWPDQLANVHFLICALLGATMTFEANLHAKPPL